MDIVMKAWLKAFLLLDRDIESNSYRKEVTGRFIILLSFIILFVVMLGNYLYSNMPIFYLNSAMLLTLTFTRFFPSKYRKYDAHFVLHFMALGILLVVYFNQGQEYTPIWAFLYICLIMSLYGHKQGLKISITFLGLLYYLLFYFTDSTVTMMEFVRFVMVSSFTLFFAYLAEMLISRSFEKLITAKAMLENLTKTDALTGLSNRRHFDEVLPQQMSSANRSNELLALVIIDIDHFKNYNDTFGHPAGDLALVALANLLKVQMKRGNDAVFRLGGEEFSLLYQAKNGTSALKLIEDIRVAVESLEQYCDLEKKITISAGLLLINARQNLTVEAAYELADKLLYQAKNSGRNKVVMSASTA
jgi:diguanylate cyclase (GGDEF)-like protein